MTSELTMRNNLEDFTSWTPAMHSVRVALDSVAHAADHVQERSMKLLGSR